MVTSAGTRQPDARRSQACRRTCPAHARRRGAPAASHPSSAQPTANQPTSQPASQPQRASRPSGRARTRAAGRGEGCRRSTAQHTQKTLTPGGNERTNAFVTVASCLQVRNGAKATPPLNIIIIFIYWGCLGETAPPGTAGRTVLCCGRARRSSASVPANLRLGEPIARYVTCSDAKLQPPQS